MEERLNSLKHILLSCAEGQMNNLGVVNAQELGEVIDMVKDLEEAQYYHSITKAMKENNNYDSRMYYDGRGGNSSSGGGRSNGNSGGGNRGGNEGGRSGYYDERQWDYSYDFRDYREGKSPRSRKMYMESKETHQDKSRQMKELDNYLRELGDDLMDMIRDSSPDEKHMLSQKITELSEKLKQANV